MVRPEACAIEGEGAGWKRDARDVFDRRILLPRIEARDAPAFVALLGAAQDVDRAIDEGVAADFRADIERVENVAALIEFQNALLVPLAQVKVLAIVAEIRAGEIRTGDAFALAEPATGNVAPQIAIIAPRLRRG